MNVLHSTSSIQSQTASELGKLGVQLYNGEDIDENILELYEVKDFSASNLLAWAKESQPLPSGVPVGLVEKLLRLAKNELSRLSMSASHRREEVQIKIVLLEQLLPRSAMPERAPDGASAVSAVNRPAMEQPLPGSTSSSSLVKPFTAATTTTTKAAAPISSSTSSSAPTPPPRTSTRIIQVHRAKVPAKKNATRKKLIPSPSLPSRENEERAPKRIRVRRQPKEPQESLPTHPAVSLEPGTVTCPVCGRGTFSSNSEADIVALNKHIDRCLVNPSRAASPISTSSSSSPLSASKNSVDNASSSEEEDEIQIDNDNDNLASQLAVSDDDLSASVSPSPEENSLSDDWIVESAQARIAEYESAQTIWASAWLAAQEQGMNDSYAFIAAEEAVNMAISSSDANGAEQANMLVTEMDDGTRLPTRLYHQLLPYQRQGVQWLAKLRKDGCGGILGTFFPSLIFLNHTNVNVGFLTRC